MFCKFFDDFANFHNVFSAFHFKKMPKIWQKMKKSLVQKITDELSISHYGSVSEAGEFGIGGMYILGS